MRSETLANLGTEDRRFDPRMEFAAHANLTESAYAEADADRVGFWEKQADRLSWDTRWTGVGLVEPAVREVVRGGS